MESVGDIPVIAEFLSETPVTTSGFGKVDIVDVSTNIGTSASETRESSKSKSGSVINTTFTIPPSTRHRYPSAPRSES